MGPVIGLHELLSMLRRRAVLVALLLSVGVVLTLAYAASLPRSFQAIALVQIQPSPLNGGSSSSAAAETTARFRLVEQRIMSRANIAEMIDRHDLFDELPLTAAERISLFRESAKIELIPALGGVSGPEGGASGLFVTVHLDDPGKAARLANDIADQVVSDNRNATQSRLRELTEVLETDDQRLRRELAELRDELARIRRDAGEALPENVEVLQTRITTLESLRTDVARSHQELERERLAVEVAGPPTGEQAAPTTVAGRIGELRVALSRATAELGANHPETRRLRQQIEELREGTAPAMPSGTVRQLELIEQQLAEIEQERTRLEAAITAARTALTRVPEVAERLEAVNGRRSAVEAEREALAARLADARLSESLSARNQGERMEILERATPPETPLSSNRRRIAILGIIGSIGLSLLAAFLLELSNPVVRSPRQLQHALGVAAIASAPHRPEPAERLSMSLSLLLAFAILTAGAIMAVRLVYPELFPPLPQALQPLAPLMEGEAGVAGTAGGAS